LVDQESEISEYQLHDHMAQISEFERVYFAKALKAPVQVLFLTAQVYKDDKSQLSQF
jgi:hypothetical protein